MHRFKSLFALSALAALLAFASTQPLHAEAAASATVTCKDGTTSKAGRGACGHHGGVQKADASATAAPTAAPAAAAPAAAAPASSGSASTSSTKKATSASSTAASSTAMTSDAHGATAKCKDGSFSHSKQHKGACSHHGGVAEWLDKQ